MHMSAIAKSWFTQCGLIASVPLCIMCYYVERAITSSVLYFKFIFGRHFVAGLWRGVPHRGEEQGGGEGAAGLESHQRHQGRDADAKPVYRGPGWPPTTRLRSLAAAAIFSCSTAFLP